jgi:23S rRNA G2069 N7-methylase RlmK/C1962 C5-methylase RlmI
MAMQVLERDGILVTCSCSHHMARACLARCDCRPGRDTSIARCR